MKKTVMLFMVFILAIAGPLYAGKVVVIANKSVPISNLSRKDVQKIFLGKTISWPDGKKINIVTIKEGDVQDTFCRDYMEKSASQFDIYWKQLIFSGSGKLPKNVASDVDVVKYVISTDGAVGYISEDMPHPGVKTIEIK